MVRCTACDLELEGPAESCPECGAPTRRAVIRVDTGVRDRYASVAAANASEDADFEYAFGGKRAHVQATTTPAVEKRRRRFRPRRASALEAPSPRVGDLEALEEPDAVETPAEEDIADVGVHDLLESLREMGAENDDADEDDEIAVLGNIEIDNVVEIEQDAAGDEVTKERGTVTELDAQEQEAQEDQPQDVVEEPDVAPLEPEPLRAESVDSAERDAIPAFTAGFAEYKPYVVLPKPRASVRPVAVAGAEPAPVAVSEPVPRGHVRLRRLTVGVCAIFAIAAAVGFAMASRGRPEAAPPRPWDTITSATDPISFRVPDTWRLESQDKGVLGLTDVARDAHVHATLIARKSLADGLTLKERAKQVRRELIRSLEDEDPSTSVSTAVGGYDAIRTEITATSVGQRVAYILTVVKTPKHFINVLAWAPAAKIKARRHVLLDIVGSLRRG